MDYSSTQLNEVAIKAASVKHLVESKFNHPYLIKSEVKYSVSNTGIKYPTYYKILVKSESESNNTYYAVTIDCEYNVAHPKQIDCLFDVSYVDENKDDIPQDRLYFSKNEDDNINANVAVTVINLHKTHINTQKDLK